MFIKVIVGLLIYLGVGAVMGDNIVFGLLCFGVALWIIIKRDSKLNSKSNISKDVESAIAKYNKAFDSNDSNCISRINSAAEDLIELYIFYYKRNQWVNVHAIRDAVNRKTFWYSGKQYHAGLVEDIMQEETAAYSNA